MPLYIIGAIDKNRGFSKDSAIPWHLPEDLKFFKEKTLNNVVIMGNTTYETLNPKYRPLPNRTNIVLTRNEELLKIEDTNELSYKSMVEIEEYIKKNRGTKDIYLIGGNSLYNCYIGRVDKIYLTAIDKDYKCDIFFPYITNNYKITDVGEDRLFDEKENVYYRFIEYTATKFPVQNENNYLFLMNDVLTKGNSRTDRTNTGTISQFAKQLTFDVSESIPLLTTKRVPIKLTIEELIFFLNGYTDTKILEEKGINIWKGNTSRKFLDNRGLNHYETGDLGTLYGFQWRRFGAEYKGCNEDYTGKGIDQLENIIHLLKTDPFSRRIIMTDYNVTDLNKGVLQPCHGLIVQLYVEEVNNVKHLSLLQYQRSADGFLGLPINIASYSILLYIIALKVGMQPKNVTISLGDVHAYSTHIEQIKEQLSREPLVPSVLKLNPEIKDKDWKDITVDDFELIGYFNTRKSIKAPMAV
jgi:dihydrofolate reductase/thymidylate synthase